MPTVEALYDRSITELWAGRPIPADIVTEHFVGHWPDRDVHGPDELHQTVQKTRNMVADFNFAIEIGPTQNAYLRRQRGDQQRRPRARQQWRGHDRAGDRDV
jgi:hypothetical protein